MPPGVPVPPGVPPHPARSVPAAGNAAPSGRCSGRGGPARPGVAAPLSGGTPGQRCPVPPGGFRAPGGAKQLYREERRLPGARWCRSGVPVPAVPPSGGSRGWQRSPGSRPAALPRSRARHPAPSVSRGISGPGLLGAACPRCAGPAAGPLRDRAVEFGAWSLPVPLPVRAALAVPGTPERGSISASQLPVLPVPPLPQPSGSFHLPLARG